MLKKVLGVVGCGMLILGFIACSGENGSNGVNGTSCEVAALKDSTGYKVLCDGDSVGVLLSGARGPKGDDGVEGPQGVKGDSGVAGASCTIASLVSNDGYKVLCGGDSVGVLLDGEPGIGCVGEKVQDDESGKKGIEVTCNNEVIGTIWDGNNGAEGASCSVMDNGDGTYVLTCGGDPMTIYKAMCGDTPYDPADKFCVLGKLYDKCGGSTYTVNTESCDNGNVIPLCAEYKHGENGTIEFVKHRTTMEEEFCWNGIVTPKCGGKEFGINEYCGKTYDGKTDSIYAYCKEVSSLESVYQLIGLSVLSSSEEDSDGSTNSQESYFGSLVGGHYDTGKLAQFFQKLEDIKDDGCVSTP